MDPKMYEGQPAESPESTLDAVRRRLGSYTNQVESATADINRHADALNGAVPIAISTLGKTANVSAGSILGKLDELAQAVEELRNAVGRFN